MRWRDRCNSEPAVILARGKPATRTAAYLRCGGSGEKPGPTVRVRMGVQRVGCLATGPAGRLVAAKPCAAFPPCASDGYGA